MKLPIWFGKSAQSQDSQEVAEKIKQTHPEVRQLSQSIQQMAEKRYRRDDNFTQVESLLDPNKFAFQTDFVQEEPKWRNIGMNFDSDADSDEDLESGMKFPTHRERHANKMPPMHLQFASTRDRQLETNRVSLPQRGADQIQIYSKPQNTLISGKHPKLPLSSPTMGTSQQLREIFDPPSKQPEKFSFQTKAQLESSLQMQRDINDLINSHVQAEPIRVQQFHPPSPNTSEEGMITTSASGYPSASSRDAKLTFYAPNQPEPVQQQASKAPAPKKTLAHFFESPSKYISVRAFHQQNEYLGEQLNELRTDKEMNKDSSRYKILKHWFKDLTMSELSVVLTTVDKELVRLLRAMYKTQMNLDQSGKFIAKFVHCNSSSEADRYEKVAQYNLLFVRDRSNFRSSMQVHSQSIQKRAHACDWLLKQLRFISVQTQEEAEEKEDGINAFTLDQESYTSQDFFLTIMKQIDPEFFMRDFTCTKLMQPVEGSLLVGQVEQAQTRPSNQKKSLKSTPATQKAYFLVQDPQRRIFASQSQTADPSQSSLRSRPDSESMIDLAQMVLLIVEKGVNIHFLDFLDKITNQQQSFFFFKMSDLSSELFSDDLKVANYWFNLPFDQKSKQLEELDLIGNDLLRMIQDSKQQFDNIKEIEEEEDSSRRSVSDSDNSDDFNCFGSKPKGRKKIGALNPRALVMTEYYEYEQERMPDTILVRKLRRGRRDRVRGLNGSEQTSSSGAPLTSSSGAYIDSTTYCDYNPNQLRAQYVGAEKMADDSEEHYRKKPAKALYECMGDMVVDPVPSDEEDLLNDNNSDYDPENLRPYKKNDTHFSNSGASFDYRNFPQLQRAKDQEETKLPAFIQSKPRINVSLPADYVDDKPRNDLLSSQQPANRIFMMKQEIKSMGLKNGTFKECLQFVKMLSTCKDIDTFVRESDTALTRQKQRPLKIEELKPVLRSRFYQKLSKICTDSILADLLEQTQPESKGKKKKAVVEKPIEQPKPVTAAPSVQEKKKNKKSKKKKKKKAEPEQAVKEKLSDPEDVKVSKFTETASGPEVSVAQSHDDSVTSSQDAKLRELEENKDAQEKQLFQLYERLERLNTVDAILDNDGCPDMCQDILSGKRVAVDQFSDSDDNNEAIQRVLSANPGDNVRESQCELRFKEERTGLLSNQIHLDKYKQETLHELQVLERRRNSPSYESSEMLHYVMSRSKDTINSQEHLNPFKKEEPAVDADMQSISHYQRLVGNMSQMPTTMTQRQKDIVLRILQDQYQKQQLAQQSGGGAEEVKDSKPVEPKPIEPEESKKKGKKNKKKNRRAHKQADTAKPIPKPEPQTKEPAKEEAFVDDVEEVILPEEQADKTVKLDKSVMRNNFLTEDVPVKAAKQIVTVSSAMVIDQEDEKDEALDREEYVQSITTKLIQSAVQSYAESPQTQPVRISKQQRKKGKAKATQEMQFQQKTKPAEATKTTMSGLSQLSSDAASNGGKGVPVYCGTPILTNQKPASGVNFKADLSDNVKIPQRGTSESSYGKEEKFHEQTLLELDSLFPSGKKGSSSGSSVKVRSSTLSKDRLGSRGKRPAMLEKIGADDVQSQKVEKKSKPEQPSSPLLSKGVINDAKVSMKIEAKAEAQEPKLTKAQKKQRRKELLKQEQERLELAKKAQEAEEQKAEVVEEDDDKSKLAKQAAKSQVPQYQPKKAAAKQPEKPAAQKQASKQKQDMPKVNTEVIKAEPKTEVVKSEPVKNEPVKAEKLEKKNKPQTFTDFDSMFESVYGAQAISGTIVQPKTEPEKKPKPDTKKGAKEIKDEAEPEVHVKKPSVEEEKKGRGVQAKLDLTKIKTEPSDVVIVHSEQHKTVQAGKTVQKSAQYSCSSVQTPTAHHMTSQITTTVIKQQSLTTHETTQTKRNRGAQFPPTPLGNSVTNSVPTVASNGSQTVQQMSTQQQQTQFNVNLKALNKSVGAVFDQADNVRCINLNIVNHTNQYMQAQNPQYMTPQQLQQQQMYIQMMQQQMMQQQYGVQLVPFGYPVQTRQVADENEETLQLQKMNQKTDTTSSTPQRQAFQLPSMPVVYQRPMMPMQYQYQKPMYYQQSFFQVNQLYARLSGALASDNIHMRLSDQETQQFAYKFLIQLGKQVQKIVSKIEARLSQIEEYKEVTFSRIKQIAKQTFSDNIEFEIYGSMATNLAIDTSDMDIAIYGAISAEKIAQSLNPRELAVTAMEQLSLRFEPIDWIVSNRVIGTASVPVIKIEIDTAKLAKTLRSGHAETDIKTLKIDIIFNDVALPRSKDADGLEVSEVHTKRAAEYVKQQITAHPFLRPLVVVLKKYLSLKNLNNSFMGTISSYGLVLMLIALLEDMKRSEPALERQTGDMFDFQLGKALAQFFFVFGECFQTQYCMVNIKNEFQEPEETIGLLTMNGAYVLQIYDPCNEANNVGKQSYKFDEVQEQLLITFECLLVRYREFYNFETKVLDLMRRKTEIDRAIRYCQGQFAKPDEAETSPGEFGSLFDDFTEAGDVTSQIFWQQTPMVWQHALFQRGKEQLKLDLKEATDLIDKFNRERQDTHQATLDRVLLINCDDLTLQQQDEEEEKQRIMLQLKKAASMFTGGYDQSQSDMYQGQDIQELMTGQQQPPMLQPMYPYKPYYQGYMQPPFQQQKPSYYYREVPKPEPAQPQHQKPEEGKRPKKKS